MRKSVLFVLCFMMSLIIMPGALAKNHAHNASPTPVNNMAPVSAMLLQTDEAQEVQGELQVGQTDSVILYVGMESGDYAAYCFSNNSEAGRAILAVCKNKRQCKVKGTVEEFTCKVPGLEADLSASGKIVKVQSVKLLGRKK